MKKKSRNSRNWDDTISDLEKLKLTPQETKLKKEIKSKYSNLSQSKTDRVHNNTENVDWNMVKTAVESGAFEQWIRNKENGDKSNVRVDQNIMNSGIKFKQNEIDLNHEINHFQRHASISPNPFQSNSSPKSQEIRSVLPSLSVFLMKVTELKNVYNKTNHEPATPNSAEIGDVLVQLIENINEVLDVLTITERTRAKEIKLKDEENAAALHSIVSDFEQVIEELQKNKNNNDLERKYDLLLEDQSSNLVMSSVRRLLKHQ